MAKKRKKEYQPKAEIGHSNQEVLSESLDLQDEQLASEETIDEQPVTEDKIELADAARRFVFGFKESWLPSILKFAENWNFPLQETEQKCKDFLKLWGARII